MKNKNTKKLMAVFALFVTLFSSNKVFAAKENTKVTLMNGINKIYYEAKLLKKLKQKNIKNLKKI
ncbi:hypothetical protein [Anaerococcus cruorum]|uniref:hypothetical protein n=1 Tax=Anaerococcus sp. WGS1596 TaxID=3366806 RepID=UPI00372D42AC